MLSNLAEVAWRNLRVVIRAPTHATRGARIDLAMVVGVSVSDKQEVVCRGSASEHSLPLQTHARRSRAVRWR